MRIFLDANILFSASKSDGAVRRLIQLLLDAGHECVIDDFVVSEARRNLLAKAPKTVEVLDRLIAVVEINTFAFDNKSANTVAWLPEKDRPVLASAIRLRCNALVTGDRRHFGAGYGKVFGGVKIYSPRALAEDVFV
jgi:predicted nucleic acid-binding protein